MRVLPAIRDQALTTDEPIEIANGYSYWTQGDLVTPDNHPPLGTAFHALPLLGMGLKNGPSPGDSLDRGRAFLFLWNPDRVEEIASRARSVSWVFGLATGLVLWWLTRSRPMACLLTLLFWSLDPLFSAFSGLAKAEIAPTFFFLVAVLAFERAQRSPSPLAPLAAGGLSALAVNSKLYCLTLLPIFIALEMIHLRKKENILSYRGTRQGVWARWIMGMGSFFTVTFLIYLPGTFREDAHHQPFYYFFSRILRDLAYAQNPSATFFLGQAGVGTRWYYLPAAFLWKEPLALLLALALVLVLAVPGKLRPAPWVWVPPLLFSVTLLPSLNIGVRYLLPALPFLFLMAGEALAWIGSNRSFGMSSGLSKALVWVLCLWQGISVLGFPGTSLGYFNELVPVERRIHYLGDSNLDWGQDLKRVAAFAKRRGWARVRLAYYGGVDPKVYGLDWIPWDEDDLRGPQPGRVYLVNASFLQLAPVAYASAKPIAESWVRDREPDGRVGDAWYYFEVPGKDRVDPKAKPLVSVPFQEYRGYTPFFSIPR